MWRLLSSWKLLFGVETFVQSGDFIQCGDFYPVWRLLCSVETLAVTKQ